MGTALALALALFTVQNLRILGPWRNGQKVGNFVVKAGAKKIYLASNAERLFNLGSINQLMLFLLLQGPRGVWIDFISSSGIPVSVN